MSTRGAASRNRWAAVACACVALSISGCVDAGGSGPGSPTGSPTGVTESGMRPERDGFGFANFTAADTDAHFDVVDLTSMFGAGTDVCLYGTADPCVPTPEAAAFARMVNLARSSGHCEGLVVRAAELFDQRPPSPVADLANAGEVTHGVIRTFATQLLAPVRREARQWSERSLGEIVEGLEAALDRGEVRYSMGLYTQSGGHTVLPISTERNGDVVSIDVYDPNWPRERRRVIVDLARERWEFSFSSPDPASDPSPWVGGAGDIDLVDIDTRRDGGCPFCGDGDDGEADEALMLVRSVGSDWSVRSRGSVLTAGSSTGVAGTVRPLRAEAGVPRDYVVDVGNVEAGVTLAVGSSTRISALWPTAIVEVEVVDPAGEVTVTIGSGGIEVTGGTATVSVARGYLGLTATSSDMRIEHRAEEIVLIDRAGRSRESVDADRKTNSDSLESLTVALPDVLMRPTDTPVGPSVPTPGVDTPSTVTTKAPRPGASGMSPLVRIRFVTNLWSRPGDDEASYGFVATDVVGGEADETQICRSIDCLGGKVVWLPRGGYDPSTDTWLLSPYEFRISAVRAPFDIRCGRSAGWSAATADDAGFSASCSFDSVDSDVVIALRSS